LRSGSKIGQILTRKIPYIEISEDGKRSFQHSNKGESGTNPIGVTNYNIARLHKASAPAEAEKAAQALIASLRNHGISGYDILGGTAPADTANPVYPSEAWQNKVKED
jgi:hypothetical protein